MKKIILAVLVVALAATVALGAYVNVGGIDAASGTTAVTANWTGPPANWITVVPTSADVTLTLQEKADSYDGLPIPIKAGTATTIYVDYFNGFTVTRASATAVQVYWGTR